MQEMQFQYLGWEDPLEKKMTTYFSILAWEIPPTGKSGVLQSWGSKESSTTEHLNNSIAINGLPWWPMVKNLLANAGDSGSIPGLGRYSGGGNENPLQYSCLENSMDRGAWRATVHEAKESDMTK